MDAFDSWMIVKGLRPETMTNYREMSTRMFTYMQVDITDYHPDHLNTWIKNVSDTLMRTSIRNYLSSFKEFLRFCYETHILQEPFHKDVPKWNVPRAIPHPTSEHDLQTLLNFGFHPSITLAITLAAYAGLRRGEICRLKFSDLIENNLHVVGKGGRERIVPASERVLNAIHNHGFTTGQLVRDTKDRPLHPPYLSRDMCAIFKQACVPGSLHHLRHRFATQLYIKTKDILLVKELLGHTKLDTVMIYVQFDFQQARSAVELIA